MSQCQQQIYDNAMLTWFALGDLATLKKASISCLVACDAPDMAGNERSYLG